MSWQCLYKEQNQSCKFWFSCSWKDIPFALSSRGCHTFSVTTLLPCSGWDSQKYPTPTLEHKVQQTGNTGLRKKALRKLVLQSNFFHASLTIVYIVNPNDEDTNFCGMWLIRLKCGCLENEWSLGICKAVPLSLLWMHFCDLFERLLSVIEHLKLNQQSARMNRVTEVQMIDAGYNYAADE